MFFHFLNLNRNSSIIVSLALILFLGFLSTRVTKRLKLPNVTGYILVGILMGPYILNLIPGDIIAGMDFVTDIALAFIAFDVGKYLKLSTLRENKVQVIVITLFEALAAAFIITITMIYIFKLPIHFSLLLGAIGSATAPASTIMTIRQYKAKGNFVNMLLQVVALDDAIALVAFSISAAVVQALNLDAKLNFATFAMPIFLNIVVIVLGVFFGFILDKLISSKRSQDNRLILGISVIFVLTGFCSAFDISPLLSCMAMGVTYINISKNKEVFRQIINFSPPILTIFFVMSGMRLNIPSVFTSGVIGVTYFVIRILGKYAGAFIGAKITKAPSNITKYFGLALVPQAGVSIGLAMIGQRILPPDMGSLLLTIILSSGVLYEMIGPVSAKIALYLSGSIPPKENSVNEKN